MITLEEEHQVLTDLHSIARELNKPFDDGDVLGEYSKRNNGCSKEIAHYVIHPIYFPPEECIINTPVRDKNINKKVGNLANILYLYR